MLTLLLHLQVTPESATDERERALQKIATTGGNLMSPNLAVDFGPHAVSLECGSHQTLQRRCRGTASGGYKYIVIDGQWSD